MSGPRPGITLDTGALIALQSYKRSRVSEAVIAAKVDDVPVTVSGIAIAEWWRGGTRRQQERQREVRQMFAMRVVDDEIAMLAGEALTWLDGRAEDPPCERCGHRAAKGAALTNDAIVMATAALHGPILYTGDDADMRRFIGFFPDVRILGIAGSA